MRAHACIRLLAHAPCSLHEAADRPSRAQVICSWGCSAVGLAGWSNSLLAGPLLRSGPKEELQESSFVSSSSTYLACLHTGEESLNLLVLAAESLQFVSALSLFVLSVFHFFLSLSHSHLLFLLLQRWRKPLSCPVPDV